jgi:DNA-binding transcriptional regulator YhcF (GntR family)
MFYDIAVLPRKVLNSKHLNDREKIVYLLILDYSRDNVIAFPSIEKLADQLDVSESTITRATKSLRERGFIRVYRRHWKAVNNYILVPLEWVDEQFVESEEQYIDQEDAYNSYVDEIKDFYHRKAGVTEFAKSGIEQIEEKIEEENYDFDAKDLVMIFVKYMKDIKDIAYSVSWGRDKKLMNDIFIKEQCIDGKDALDIIKKFIKVYDDEFKRKGYEYPEIRWLKVEWIFTKVVKLLLLEEKAKDSGEWLESDDNDLQEEF